MQQEERDYRLSQYTQFCNLESCLKELGDGAVQIEDEFDDDRVWYHNFCSEECLEQFLQNKTQINEESDIARMEGHDSSQQSSGDEG